MPAKVLFLAIDAGDKFLVRDWAANGILPNLRSLLDRGLTGNTMSLKGFFVGATWPSFYTGVTPARHGFHSLVRLKPGTYEFSRCGPRDFIRNEPFWNFLGRAGKKVAVLDVPLTYTTKNLNGIQMVEWGSHDANSGFSTWPPQLKPDVWARFGRYPLKTSCDSIGRTPQDFCAFRDLLIKSVRQKTELTIHYLKSDKWDFFAQVFTEAHCAGHQCWHLHDPEHPDYDPKTTALTGDPILEVYKAIDTAIGKILDHVDSDTIVFFLASHRMARYYGAQSLLPEILTRLKAAAPWPVENSPDDYGKFFAFLRRGWKNTSVNLKPVLLPVRNFIYNQYALRSPIIPKTDPAGGDCFIMFNGSPVSGLRVNLCGREPDGNIKPGPDMDRFSDRLTDDLMKLVDCGSGRPLINGVMKTAALYRGEYLDHLPDLLIEWNDEIAPGSEGPGNPNGGKMRIFSEKTGIIEGVNTYCRSGDHRPEGLFVASGPNIKRGRLERTVSIMDFAPTFTGLLGVELPHADGQPVREIL
ncbi:MAG: hypothetical protein C4560_07040 [Nitrospiraceae bacterium]|nr:MAG: hypothetical protein C4560_07040 [Nitrospiraceae bacterium]